ncbi:50S ribosomal protein L17 [Gleimia hominis]|uniref:50S ribosomal protein L17 n=1 Tax=Gleimia hominis TaxID=595468 RepID=A0ABU3ICG5_9ACTO|nr:50S ribosomal protein L17 [Gleimia hominis]MDT3767167.1 50S ribosomal protein L17 [Gleimia hominis]
MPTPTKGARLGSGPAHEKHILANLARDLFEHKQITTTRAKARRLQPYAEKLITKARRGDIHARRTVAKKIQDKDILYVLFDEVAKQIDPERAGGYTRIVDLPPRRGDNAPMAQISLVLEKVEKKAVVKEAQKTAQKAADKAEAEEVSKSAEDKEAQEAKDEAGKAAPAAEAETGSASESEAADTKDASEEK